MQKELVSKQSVIKKIKSLGSVSDPKIMIKAIKEMSSDVTRCQYCKHWCRHREHTYPNEKSRFGFCELDEIHMYTYDNFFCGYAEDKRGRRRRTKRKRQIDEL